MNIAEGISQNIQWGPVRGRVVAGKILLDVRNPAELPSGQFMDFLHIPLGSTT
jgi:hypothetical protein